MSTLETLTRYVWAESPSLAWGLVNLREADDGAWLSGQVHTAQEDAERQEDKRTGTALYRVTRTSTLADESTPAPEGEDWVFTYSTEGRHDVWSKPNCYSSFPGVKRLDGFWTFPEPREPIERAAWANLEPRTVGYGTAFRAYLLAWSVDVVGGQQGDE
ncbi:hypothetical protein FNV58_01045 (plasmid) [Streptomyces sp. RLB1-9]|uniref:hypothetical protein n=1 Tax=Streptomyces sp. RLB1-9 TaxID=2594454 RepID=UPI00116561E3|nr:hypothetical protein [Streptomyces sp. RLB1-9]QDN94947.1 hypothetical protein FNV58_01045 [Streptomyces sp. RLB1-9]